MQKSHKQYSKFEDSKICKGWKTTQKNQHLLQDVTKENQKEIHDYQHTTHIFQTHEKTIRNSD
jgi:hypothetical protein